MDTERHEWNGSSESSRVHPGSAVVPTELDIDPDRVRESVDGVMGRRVSVFRETASTNDLVRDMALGGAPEGEVAVADRQSRGRGQFGRRWDSATGLGLWFSVLLRPTWGREFLERVTPLVAVAVAGGIAEATGLLPRIKPPNDVFVDGRKVAGILTEARTGRDTFAVVGIGVNVSHAVADFPLELQTTATSLALSLGRPVERERVLVAILRGLNQWYAADVPPGDELADTYAALSRRPGCDSLAS